MLKKTLEPWLPNEVLYRRKQGFATSLASLFRHQTDRVRARLLGPTMLDSGYFDRTSLARMLDEHAAGRFDHSMALWHLLVFEGFLASEMANVGPEALAA